MADFSGATTAVTNSARVLLDSGPASAISNTPGKIPGGKTVNVTLPLTNPLSAYPTYDYVIGLGALTNNDINFPDSNYLAGKPVSLICKSGGANPANRIQTAYGKFDFFIDDLSINGNIGQEKNANINTTTLSFKVVEPYSMGMFMLALQTAAYQADHANYRTAPYLLTLEFRGNSSKGTMELIKGTSRYIPFLFTSISIRVTEQGTEYTCEGITWNSKGFDAKVSQLKSDTSIKGETVQQILQTGEKSLQVVVNQKLKDIATANGIAVPDEIAIIFPTDTTSASDSSATGNKESADGATTKTAAATENANSKVFQKLGVSKSTQNGTLVQKEAQCNEIGRSLMKFDEAVKGDAPIGKDSVVYDSKNKVDVRANNTINIKESDFRFAQGTDIVGVINEVIKNSKFATETLAAGKIDPTGMRTWWRVEPQVYVVSTGENMNKTGKNPELTVYRVVKYKTHSSHTLPPNTKPQGYEKLQKEAVKVYDYIYTGRNTEVLKFDIEFNTSFDAKFAVDNFNSTQDVKQAEQTGTADRPVSTLTQEAGSAPPAKLGVAPTQSSFDWISSNNENIGGGGKEDAATRAVKLFHDAITNGIDMVMLNMQIMGDPYFIAQSGQGNYNCAPTQYSNLNADGTANWQNGEVDILVNLRTPIDIDHGQGLYKFAGGKSAPVVQFSGLYSVVQLNNRFSAGKFTQTLSGIRRNQQENPSPADPTKAFSTSNSAPLSATSSSKGVAG